MRSQTSAERIERQMRISAILSMRLSGSTLQQIGDAQDPPVSAVAIHKTLKRSLSAMLTETVEHARRVELLRLDELLAGIYPRATQGDIAAIDRVLAIMKRRASMLGLDLQPSREVREIDNIDPATGERRIRLEIINDPEVGRREYLYRQRIEALGGDPNIEDDGAGPKLN
jgi:hypothetical protein